jgi:Chaperone of endosialidase
MAMNFPNNPLLGQEFTSGNVTYIWNGYGWSVQGLPDFVDVAGDTMTGDLKISKSIPALILDRVDLNPAVIQGRFNNLNRWAIVLGNTAAETGANDGSHMLFTRYTDAGAVIDTPILLNRKTGRGTLSQNPVDPMDIATKGYVDAVFGGGGPGYLPLTGGTLTGALYLPTMTVKAAAGTYGDLNFSYNNVQQWLVRGSDPSAGNFELHRYGNDGGYLGSPFSINRANGNTSVTHALAVGGQMSAGNVWSTVGYLSTFSSDNATITNITSYGTANLTTVNCGNLTSSGTFTQYATANMTHLNVGGNLNAAGYASFNGNAIYIRTTSIHCNVFFHDNTGALGTELLQANPQSPSSFSIRRGGDPERSLTIYDSGATWSSYGYNTCDGIYGGPQPNAFNFAWSGQLGGWIDNSFLGQVVFNSDYRIKKDVEPLDSMWEKVKLLRPVKYTQAEYTPPPLPDDALDFTGEPIKPERRLTPRPLFEADNTERWGFIAHELQETLIMNAASAYKDAPNAIQSPNPWTMLASLTKALQEAMGRIEVLEARLGMRR